MLKLLAIATLTLIFSACRKNAVTAECEKFRIAIVESDIVTARNAITIFISKLPSQKYSKENLDKLAAYITSRCAVSANVLCYSCIKTSPEQSEIKLTLTLPDQRQVKKIIDVTYTPERIMKVLNMHD
jgi:maleate cis-trans isomerase